jgi:hypothetical protein
MGKKEKEFPKGKGVPKVDRDGFTLPQHPIGDLHVNTLGGHPIHPDRFPPVPQKFRQMYGSRADAEWGAIGARGRGHYLPKKRFP